MSNGSEWHIRILGGMKRRGQSTLDRDITSITLIGGTDRDVSQDEFTTSEVTLNLIALLGGVRVIVPRGVNVVVQGFTLLGSRSVELADELPTPDASMLRIRVFSLIGGVHVENR